MSTTTIRIEDELKARVAAVAELAGKTAHAFIVDAIAQTVEQAEQDNAFHAIADKRWARIQSTGETVPWDAAKTYLEARAKGERPRKPAARKFKA
jgi:predicted transcriptional regulator